MVLPARIAKAATLRIAILRIAALCPALALLFTPPAATLSLTTSLLATAQAQPPAPSQPATAPVTWSQHIAPVLYRNCTTCHHPGGAGPFSLLTYPDARRWAQQVLTVTQSRYMPPWLPEPGYGEFADARRLSDADLALIRNWVSSGLPEGDHRLAPQPPQYTSEWQLGTPDLILTASQPFAVPASGEDVFRNFVLPTSLATSRYVRAMEILPGNPRVVHHANVLVDRTNELRAQHPSDWQSGVPGMEISLDSGDTFDPDSHFLFWKPDTPALVAAPSMPWRLDPGNDLVLNTHLKPTGKPETVQPRIGLYFTSGPPKQQPILVQLENDAALNIPSGAAHFTIEDELRLPLAVKVLAIYPHAHYLGKDMRAWASLPNGEKRPLIWIKDWDIDRQSVYTYKEPVLLPAGTVLHMRFVYDNSAGNPRNPHNPPVRVTAGNRSEDEMGHLWLQLLPLQSTGDGKDSRMLVERAWMEHRLRKDPDDPVALYNLASLESMTGDPRGAEALYRKILTRDPLNPRALSALGVAQASAGDWHEAEVSFTQALTADPANTNARYDLARLYLDHDKASQAEVEFRHLLTQNRNDLLARVGLATALFHQQRLPEAAAEFDQALALDPHDPAAQSSYGQFQLAAGHPERAVQLFEGALAATPNDLVSQQQLAFAYAQTGRIADAEKTLRTALAANPADAATHALLSQLLGSEGQLSAAVREQQSALKLAPNDPDGWSNLGVLEARSGHLAEARRAFEHALALDPGHQAAQANLARLASAHAGP